ncbi:RrF2 family transcriptional regulator [Sediminicola luteus]|uniref:Rrf2 family transcriptional regulator n=1 Tax=Sediminicola luteus TaxID=319238 RepID=A0A2A4G804_9FLAO|nr:Rrf2 family transcriptional regulator [Sediminicola luteus]PCE64094.1 hypothetical protein B7P33_12735 [Sediminicola luteus]
MFSNSLKYSLKAISYLAGHSSVNRKYGIKELAEKTQVPAPYLGKLLQKLSREGVISSLKGPHGGFYLSPENKSKHIDSVVYLIDGEDRFKNCILDLDHCNATNPCALHKYYAQVKGGFLSQIETITLGDLAQGTQVLGPLA